MRKGKERRTNLIEEGRDRVQRYEKSRIWKKERIKNRKKLT